MSNVLLSILDDYEISDLLFTITADSAANNLKMGKIIEEKLKNKNNYAFNAKNQLLSCTAHVLNLACQDIIKNGIFSEAPLEADVYNNNITPDELNEGINDVDDELLNDEEMASCLEVKVVKKLRKGCIKIK